MKSNYKKIFFSIISFFAVIGIVFFMNLSNKETMNKTYNDEVLDKVRSQTIYSLIKESIEEVHKGPGPEPEKIAYITIDDGPSKYTNDILDILRNNEVKATFFMIEGNMRKHEQEVKNVKEQGHSVGFHSVTHDIKQLYKNPEATLNEFDTCNETFYNITGYTSKLIRLPYGSKPYMPQASYDILRENDYIIWDWNLDTQDWRATTDNIVSNIMYYARNKQNLVVLMHEKEQTVNALDSMIKILKERGYTIRPINKRIEERNYWKDNL